MKVFIKKFLSLIMICFVALTAFACESNPSPNYDCGTCKDEGVIDCPKCHVKRCNYESYNKDEYCEGGFLYRLCENCNGVSYIGKKRCDDCNGKGYDVFDKKCKNCNGSGLVKIDCPKCGIDGYYWVYRSCSKCENGLIGGTQCSDKSCSLPYSDLINDGYTYIDCPDCE